MASNVITFYFKRNLVKLLIQLMVFRILQFLTQKELVITVYLHFLHLVQFSKNEMLIC